MATFADSTGGYLTPSTLSILLNTPTIRPRNRQYSIPPQSCPQAIFPAPSLFPRPYISLPSVPSSSPVPGSHSTVPLPRLAPSPKPRLNLPPGPDCSRSSTTEEEWKKSEDSCLADIWRGEVTPVLMFDEDQGQYFLAWEEYSRSEDAEGETKDGYWWSWEGRSRAWTDGGYMRGRWLGAALCLTV
ncbi:hypothetical protein IAR50_005990 [Cryptococcus sp. DSM 104548]